jgi:thiamine-phosphate pyrophosphorylase
MRGPQGRQHHASTYTPTVPLDLTLVDALAADAHQGQTRRHGAPYIEHPRAVLRLVDDLAYAVGLPIDDAVRATALLHDVIEDSPVTEASLAEKFGADVARRVALLTKTGKGPDATRAYYDRLMREADPATRLVKACDRCHNLSELHKDADAGKLAKYVEETRQHVIPLAATVPGLRAALDDAMRTALRAQHAVKGTDKLPPGLYAIVEPTQDVDELVLRARALCQGGVALIQLRSKGKDDREVLDLVALLVAECARYDVDVVVNDRADLCVAAGADGVHVGRTDLPAAVARRIVGRDAIVGTSTHTYDQLVHKARASGAVDAADYLALGPIFESPTKKGHAAVVGVNELARAAKDSKRPVAAIGGITSPARVAECARAGAHLVCALSALALPPTEAHAMARRMSLTFFAARAAHRSAS